MVATHPRIPSPWPIVSSAVFIALILATPAHAGEKRKPAPAPHPVEESISTAFAKIPASVQVSVAAGPVGGGPLTFEKNADLPLKPASVMKLFTTAAAAVRFGDAFAYETRAYFVDGELIVIGGGDPALGDERIADRKKQKITAAFEQWADALIARGITQIERIALDDSIFDQEYRHPDWPEEQAGRWYQAPPGGLNLNDNCVDIEVRIVNKKPQISFMPPLPAEFVINAVTLGGKTHVTAKREPNGDIFRVTGTAAGTTRIEAISVGRPSVFFGHSLREVLGRKGISVRGDVVRRELGSRWPREDALIGKYSTGLGDVLWRCNTFSQNLFAECILKSLAAYAPDGGRTGTAGSWTAGAATAKATLGNLGLSLKGLKQCDGSGLSHENRVSAGEIVELLRAMYRHPQRDLFINSLARAGEEGSMKRRYGEFRGKLVGKTGTIDGVHALAGYLTRADGRVVAFAILVNGSGGAALPEKLCRGLLR